MMNQAPSRPAEFWESVSSTVDVNVAEPSDSRLEKKPATSVLLNHEDEHFRRTERWAKTKNGASVYRSDRNQAPLRQARCWYARSSAVENNVANRATHVHVPPCGRDTARGILNLQAQL